VKRRHHRVFRLLASTVTAAALVVPVTAAVGSSGGSVRATGTSPLKPQSPAPIVVRVNGGFDWTAAGAGAAGGVGLVLVVGAATAALRRRRRVEGGRI
jgi:hypothetical protein